MPNTKSRKSGSTIVAKSQPIVIKLPSGLEAKQANRLAAYMVDSGGQVIAKAAFEDGSARVAKTGADDQKSRIFIGLQFPEDYPSSKIDIHALVTAGASQISGVGGLDQEIKIQHLPPDLLNPFPVVKFCEVQGTVTNSVLINGVPNVGPVCKARVHICSVEWFFIWPIWLRPVISQQVLDELKQDVLTLRKGSTVPQSTRATLLPSKAHAGPKPLPEEVESQILAATTDNIQEVAFNNREILFPYFCWRPIFWPWFYRIVEQEVVYTDCNGYYQGWLVSLAGASPWNVYVWVEACIGGIWQTVYNPPFPCHTYWDYVCGTEIDVTLNNPAILPCSCGTPPPNGTIWFTSIGTYGIAINIQQDASSTSQGISNVGCTNFNDANQLAPFGDQLELYLAYGVNPPPGATHYRWKWTDLSVSGAMPKIITGAAGRPYLFPISGGYDSGTVAPWLEADNNGNVAYAIQSSGPTAYGAPAGSEWVNINFVSAVLDSTQVLNGHIIRLDLELLKLAGGVFQVVSVPVGTFVVSNNTNANGGYGGTQPAPYTTNGNGNNYLTLDPNTPNHALSLSLKVMVDNFQVKATINEAQVLPDGISNSCGFTQFQDRSQSVLLSFVTSEAFNRATFYYSLTKGNSNQILSASGYIFLPAAPFSLSGAGNFSDTPTVGSLLGSCTQAAFAEYLSVSSLATDGTNALAQDGKPYFDSAISAFALIPQPPMSSP